MTRAPAKRKTVAPPPHPPLFYSLHALLHTVRLIQSHEDQLCTLLHEMQTSGLSDRALLTELRHLLDELPAAEYQNDLASVHKALAGTASAPRPARKRPVKATKAVGRASRPSAKSASQRPSKAKTRKPTRSTAKGRPRL